MVFRGIRPPTGESRFTLKIAIEVDGYKSTLRDHVKHSIVKYFDV